MGGGISGCQYWIQLPHVGGPCFGLYLRNRSFLRLKYRKHLCLEADVTRGQANTGISGRLAESGIVQLQSVGEIMVL